MPIKIKYHFSGKLWKYEGKGGWHFISLPSEISKEIRENMKWQEEGWGRMKATAEIKKAEWATAIWFDKKTSTYVLPVKTEIRKKTSVVIDETVAVKISL